MLVKLKEVVLSVIRWHVMQLRREWHLIVPLGLLGVVYSLHEPIYPGGFLGLRKLSMGMSGKTSLHVLHACLQTQTWGEPGLVSSGRIRSDRNVA